MKRWVDIDVEFIVYRINRFFFVMAVLSNLGTQLEGHFLGLGSEAYMLARSSLLEKKIRFLPYTFLLLGFLIFLHLILSFFQIFTDFQEFLPEVLDFLIFFLFNMVNRKNLLSIDTIQLNLKLVYLILFIIQLLFQLIQIGFKQSLSRRMPLKLLLFDPPFPLTSFLLTNSRNTLKYFTLMLVLFRFGCRLFVLAKLNPLLTDLSVQFFIIHGQLLVPFLQVFDLILYILQIAETFQINFILFYIFIQLMDLLIGLRQGLFILFELPLNVEHLFLQFFLLEAKLTDLLLQSQHLQLVRHVFLNQHLLFFLFLQQLPFQHGDSAVTFGCEFNRTFPSGVMILSLILWTFILRSLPTSPEEGGLGRQQITVLIVLSFIHFISRVRVSIRLQGRLWFRVFRRHNINLSNPTRTAPLFRQLLLIFTVHQSQVFMTHSYNNIDKFTNTFIQSVGRAHYGQNMKQRLRRQNDEGRVGREKGENEMEMVIGIGWCIIEVMI